MAVGLAGCDGADSPAPTAPSAVQAPLPPPAPTPTRAQFPPGVLSAYTLSGVVFEVTPTGKTPIEGVAVYCELCGAETHSGRSPTRAESTASPECGRRPVPRLPSGSARRGTPIRSESRHVRLCDKYWSTATRGSTSSSSGSRAAATFSAGRSGRHRSSAANGRTRGNSRQA